MKTIIKALGVIGIAAALAVPAVPAQAQSLSFSFGQPHFPFIMLPHVSVRPHGNVGVRFSSDMPRWMAGKHRDRCEDRYRSYDAWTDTYLGFDGDRHFCRL